MPTILLRLGEAMIVSTIDYHTAGEPFRIVTGGIGPIPGATMLDKRRYAAEHLDRVRELLINEPRGHPDMYGGFLTDPADDGADLGVLFFHNAGYSTACGHGTIALATAALETGMLPRSEPETELILDVPSGRLPVTIEVGEERVGRARFRNVPSFVLAEGVEVDTHAGRVRADLAYGGAFYAFVDVERLGVTVSPPNVGTFIELGREAKRALERDHDVVHPLEPELRDVYGVVFYQRESTGSELRERNVAIFADGEVDRSPCGSGTSARIALLHARDELTRGASFVNASVIGTEFEARVVDETEVAGMPSVIPEIAGSAHLTGFHQFLLEPDDPLGTGFLLR